MPAESNFEPIPVEALRSARMRLAGDRISIETWAVRRGFNPSIARKVLNGERKAIRGISLRIAIALGLRPDPAHPAPQPGLPDGQPAGRTEELPRTSHPASSSIAGGAPKASCDRRPLSQLGEPVR